MTNTSLNRIHARIQYLSGLYLNKRSTTILYPTPVAPILALLGDIGSIDCPKTMEFIHWCSEKYEKVIWVPGVEEMRDSSVWQERLNRMDEKLLGETPNVVAGYGNPITLQYSGIPFTVIASPGWFSHQLVLYKNKENMSISEFSLKCLAEEEKQMVDESFEYTRRNSAFWNPILLTYWPVFLKNRAPLTANLYGKSTKNLTEYYKNQYWFGVNRAGLSGYNEDAFYEFSIGSTGQPKAPSSQNIDSLVLNQLTQPNQMKLMLQ